MRGIHYNEVQKFVPWCQARSNLRYLFCDLWSWMCLLALAWMKWFLSALKLIRVSPPMLILSRMCLYFFFAMTAMIKQTFVIICRGRRCVGEPCTAGEETCVSESRHAVKFLKTCCWWTADHASLAVNVYSSSRTSVSVSLILNMMTWIQQCLIITQVPILHKVDTQHSTDKFQSFHTK